MSFASTHNRPALAATTRPARAARTCAFLLVIASASAAAGCGASGSPAATGGSGASTNSKYQQMVSFSECMRTHGVAGFPDPQPSGNGADRLLIQAGPGSTIKPSSAVFQSAQQACAKLLPNGGRSTGGGLPAQAKQQALRYSACMRSHGVPGFPDPQFSGTGMRLQLSQSSGADRAAPAFAAAQKACGSPFPGGIVKSIGGPS